MRAYALIASQACTRKGINAYAEKHFATLDSLETNTWKLVTLWQYIKRSEY